MAFDEGRHPDGVERKEARGPQQHQVATASAQIAQGNQDLSERKTSWNENLARKEALCEKAEALAQSTDWDKAAGMLTDDFFITEADPMPMAGVYRGKYALRDLFTEVMGMVDVVGLDRVQTTVGGDYAVTILSFRFADPALAPAELCEMFRFRDGKCCEIRPYYFDPAQFIAAVAAKQAAAGA